MKAPTIQDYQRQLSGKDCKWCRRENYDNGTTEIVPLDNEPIEHYEHDGGYPVEGYKTNRWLYVVCPKCNYQWSLWKLGISKNCTE